MATLENWVSSSLCELECRNLTRFADEEEWMLAKMAPNQRFVFGKQVNYFEKISKDSCFSSLRMAIYYVKD
jgi:hypothetical protein